MGSLLWSIEGDVLSAAEASSATSGASDDRPANIYGRSLEAMELSPKKQHMQSTVVALRPINFIKTQPSYLGRNQPDPPPFFPACLSTPRFGMLIHRADDVVVHHSVSWGWGRTVGGYLSLLPRATANETKRFQGTVWKRVAAGFVGTGLREGDHE
jgi:hypothetical protein